MVEPPPPRGPSSSARCSLLRSSRTRGEWKDEPVTPPGHLDPPQGDDHTQCLLPRPAPLSGRPVRPSRRTASPFAVRHRTAAPCLRPEGASCEERGDGLPQKRAR
eukprot:365764-Chlamydomonas_euryale.AAC.4